jgi:hypothetical protein
MDKPTNPLPYTDTKPTGAADFYFAINATFRFILQRLGMAGLQRYWTELGEQYHAPIAAQWQQRGLSAIAEYWRAFFAAEPGAEVRVVESDAAVIVHVDVCPAIAHLRRHGREIVPCFCQHCYFVSEAMAHPAAFTVRIQGGNGRCQQTFSPRAAVDTPQDFSQIEAASC